MDMILGDWDLGEDTSTTPAYQEEVERQAMIRLDYEKAYEYLPSLYRLRLAGMLNQKEVDIILKFPNHVIWRIFIDHHVGKASKYNWKRYFKSPFVGKAPTSDLKMVVSTMTSVLEYSDHAFVKKVAELIGDSNKKARRTKDVKVIDASIMHPYLAHII